MEVSKENNDSQVNVKKRVKKLNKSDDLFALLIQKEIEIVIIIRNNVDIFSVKNYFQKKKRFNMKNLNQIHFQPTNSWKNLMS
jgi:hypothetical protein